MVAVTWPDRPPASDTTGAPETMSAMIEFLAVVQPPLRNGETIEVRYIIPGQLPIRRFYTSHEALARDASAMASRTNVYFGVTLRRGGGTAFHCTRAGALWCDVDAKLWPDARHALTAAACAIEAFPLQPSAVICTAGGFHLYWTMVPVVDLRDSAMGTRIELLNAGLARAVCGPERQPDHTHDRARVLRLPATNNFKYVPARPVTVEFLRPACTYNMDAVATLLEERYPWALRSMAGSRLSPVTAISPRALDHAVRIRALQRMSPTLRALLTAPGAGRYQSPSEADSAVACSLIAAGVNMDEALTILLESPRATDHALRKRGREQAELAYWQRTMSNAAAYVGPVVGTARRVPARRTFTAPHRPAAAIVTPQRPPATGDRTRAV